MKITNVYERRSRWGCQRCHRIFGGSSHVIEVRVGAKIVHIRACGLHAIMAMMQKAVA